MSVSASKVCLVDFPVRFSSLPELPWSGSAHRKESHISNFPRYPVFGFNHRRAPGIDPEFIFVDIIPDTSAFVQYFTSISPSTSYSIMPIKFNWTVERERHMLLLAICEANLKPTMETWAIVAKILGGGISPSAVRCGRILSIISELSIQMPALRSLSRHGPVRLSCAPDSCSSFGARQWLISV